MNDSIYLTKPEAAKLLCCSIRTLDTMREKRGLPFVTLPGCRKILFDRQRLLDWVQTFATTGAGVDTSNNDTEAEDNK